MTYIRSFTEGYLKLVYYLNSSVLDLTLTMEDLSKRLPRINQYILKNVDGKAMVNFKQTSRGIYQTLDREKFCWIKIINQYNERFEEFQDPWKKVTSKTPIRIIKKLALATNKFFKTQTLTDFQGQSRIMAQWHPLFIAAEQGSFQLYEYIIIQKSYYLFTCCHQKSFHVLTSFLRKCVDIKFFN